jgi:hypothetical protein
MLFLFLKPFVSNAVTKHKLKFRVTTATIEADVTLLSVVQYTMRMVDRPVRIGPVSGVCANTSQL